MYSVQVSGVADIKIKQTTILMSVKFFFSIIAYIFYSCSVSPEAKIDRHHLPSSSHIVAIYLGQKTSTHY